MVDESKILWVLDFLSERAREFIQVSDDIIKGERGLQSRDEDDVTEWQTCSVLSAFINYIAETERLRYGHFAYDIDKSNNENKAKTAKSVLDRMSLFWDYSDDDIKLTETQLVERQKHIEKFLLNDDSIRKHMAMRPDMYDGSDQSKHRDWSVRLKLLGAREAMLLRQWKKLLQAQSKSESSQISLQP